MITWTKQPRDFYPNGTILDSERARIGRFSLEVRTCAGKWEGYFDGPCITGAYDDIDRAKAALLKGARKRLVAALAALDARILDMGGARDPAAPSASQVRP